MNRDRAKRTVHSVGRPPEFNQEVLEKANAYINSCLDSFYQQVKTEGKDSTTWDNKIDVKMPTIEGLAFYLTVSRQTVYNWEAQYAEFGEITERIKQIQADRLIQKGLSGDYNPTIAKVILGKHGYIEKVEETGRPDRLTEAEEKKLRKLLK